MGLPKTNRLRQRRDFTLVYQRGIRRKSRYLTLRAFRFPTIVPSAERSEPRSHLVRATRIGISISLKVSKRSVVRNRIKRQIRSGLRQFLPRLVCGWDLVIVVHPEAVECDYLQFLQELEQLLMQAEVIHGGE